MGAFQTTIYFLYGRRESLQSKSEAYKKSVREYLESFGFAQTTDSAIQGTFADMIFVNPTIEPGKKFLIESKAETVSLKTKKFARELIGYFKLSQAGPLEGMSFKLFAQGVRKPSIWESVFSEKNDFEIVREWCVWYNDKCLEAKEDPLNQETICQVFGFFAKSEVIVGTAVDLQHAALDNQSLSMLSISKMATNLFNLVERRRGPIPKKSRMVMNILPISVPKEYYLGKSTVRYKKEIYDSLRDETIPPFLFTNNKEILTFADLDKANPLSSYIKNPITTLRTEEFQKQNLALSAELVNIHLRRIFWNKGLYRDPRADVYYFPMRDKTKERIEVFDHRGKKRWVVRKIIRTMETKYHKKGEINFFFHRGVELRTPTYWGESYCELIPRRYYTLDGEKWVDGEIRARIDRKFRNPKFDRCKTRLGLMKFWKFILFEPGYLIPPERWFEKFKFGNFLTETVNWSPKVIGRTQMRIWDYKGES
jgi:hypothetical protein